MAKALYLLPDRVSSMFSSIFTALTSSDMRALCLCQVNLWMGRFGEEQSEKRIGKNGSGLSDSFIERGVAIVHGRSPMKTTHNDLRLAVETLSGGRYRSRSVLASVNYIRMEFGKCPASKSNRGKSNRRFRDNTGHCDCPPTPFLRISVLN